MGLIQDEFNRVIHSDTNPEALLKKVLNRIAARKGIALSEVQLQVLRDAASAATGTEISVAIGEPGIVVRLTTDELNDELEKCLDDTTESIERTVHRVVEQVSSHILSSLYANAPRALEERRQQRRRFERRLAKRWKQGLDRLEMLVMIAHEAGDLFQQDLRKVAQAQASRFSNEDECLLEVLFRLHARACRTAAEILCLLRGGFADGANARWRSLHEIAVVGMLMAQHRGDLPRRYIAHAAVERYRASRQYQLHCERLGYPPLAEEEIPVLRARYDAVLKEFGEDFGCEYGWATNATQKSNPRFIDIERAREMEFWRPYYKMACHSVHAGAQGLFFCLGLLDNEATLLPGASNVGLCDPGYSCAISLTMATAALMTAFPDLDSLVMSRIMMRLCDEIGNSFLETHRTFENTD